MLWITQYASVMNGPMPIPIPVEPDLGSQCLAVGNTSVQSTAWTGGTKFIRVHAEEACCLHFGANPVATATDVYMPANGTEFFAVTGGQKVAVIGLPNQTQSRADNLSGLLKLLSDPKARQAELSELIAKTQTAAQMQASANASIKEMESTKAALAVKQHEIETRTAALEAAREQAAKEHAIALDTAKDLDARIKAHAEAVKAFTAERAKAQMDLNGQRAAFEQFTKKWKADADEHMKSIAARMKQLDEREAALKAGEAAYQKRMARLKELAA
jgi:hypothetical protein